MGKILTDAQRAYYDENGYFSPVDVMSPAEALEFRKALERSESEMGHTVQYPERTKAHLFFDWADRAVRHPRLLDAVEDIIGPNILVYNFALWVKEPQSPARILWHQDSAYFYLEPEVQVTAWLAVSDASEAAGCMRVIRGSHKWGLLPHMDRPGPTNLIRRGQSAEQLPPDDAGDLMPLRPGQVSLHHTNALHASLPNTTSDRRIGFGISYIPTHVKPNRAPQPTAMLVRGVDTYNHFIREIGYRPELSPADRQAYHLTLVELYRCRQDAGFDHPGQQKAA